MLRGICLAAGLALPLALGLGSAMALEPASNQAEDAFPPLEDVVRGERYWNVVEADESTFGRQDYADLLEQIPPARNRGTGWEIHKTEWSDADERGYEAFVTAIGRSGCISIDDCLRSDANPYRDLDDPDFLWLGDCTDMVYVLRGYYAWKNGLPFSYEDGLAIRPGEEAGHDARYSKYGNTVTSRADVVHPKGRAPYNGQILLNRLFNIVSTAMLRVHPDQDGKNFGDFYPVKISREAVRPGTIAYDIYGHVSIVYDVMDDGRLLMISSHPDYTVSRDTFGHNVVRSAPDLGSGLKAWRPIRLVDARRTSQGTYIGGRIVGARNEDLPDFSMEQYWGTHPDESGRWDRGRFFADGRFMAYYDFVKARLRKPGTPFDPVQEMANATEAMCASFLARKTAVNLAVYAGLPEEPAYERLPDNIYGTYGDWERYATPSRDARLRTQAVELNQLAYELIARHDAGDPLIDYPTGDLAAALFDVYDRTARSCRIYYKRSDGSRVKLTMHHAMDRLFDLSFDPYHCPERRWGATGRELDTCLDDQDKTRWYKAQRYLRNDPDRTYDLRTNFTAEELKDPSVYPPEEGGIGKATPPKIDFAEYLETVADGHTQAGADLPATIIKNSSAVNDLAERPDYRVKRQYRRQTHDSDQ